MANEFVARKGLISSGSINVSGSVTASFFKGDGSQLTNLPSAAAPSSSVSIDTFTFSGDGVTQNYILSQSYDVSSLFVSVEGLSQTNIQDYTLTGATLSFINAPPTSSNILVKALMNVTQNMTGSFSGSFFGIFASSSFATSASFASTASNLVGGAKNYIPLWTSTGAQSSSTVYQLSTNVGINNLAPSASLHVSGGLMLQHVYERVNITGSAPPATFTLDIASGSIFYRSASTSANWTLNFRGDIATPLNTIMYNGQVLTATVMTIQGATPYSASAIQIDGAAIIPRWQGGTSSSTANGLEVSTYTIVKIASASYNLLASVTRYI